VHRSDQHREEQPLHHQMLVSPQILEPLSPTPCICDKPLTLSHRHCLQTLERKIYRQPGAQVPSVQELTDSIRFLYGLTTEDDAQIMRYVVKDHFKKQVRPCRVSIS
jgi:hypothetical protein